MMESFAVTVEAAEEAEAVAMEEMPVTGFEFTFFYFIVVILVAIGT